MEYIDGFVAAVPDTKKNAYLKMAQEAAEVFKDHGAVRVVECWGDDVPEGELTSFPMAVQRKQGETVVFSWVAWPSKEARDKGNQKVMQDPRMKWDDQDPPFDGKRMIFGGFQMILDQ
jgi:uncharacterized protein YbaA (DUF1428 family)